MKRKHQRTLSAIFDHPISANIKWADVISLMRALNAEILEREGSRVAFILNDHVSIQHRPHPNPTMDKGAVADLRDFLKLCGIKP
ncbi:MAG: type II toxin-antitoxin system HicA family toxin [Nitrococcus mobilis]|nr:type II toxin-antitoxin system HicA family toxin [Nitrococcus mobilis]